MADPSVGIATDSHCPAGNDGIEELRLLTGDSAMKRGEKKPERRFGVRDVVSAWAIFAVLFLGLVVVSFFEPSLPESLRAIAELR